MSSSNFSAPIQSEPPSDQETGVRPVLTPSPRQKSKLSLPQPLSYMSSSGASASSGILSGSSEYPNPSSSPVMARGFSRITFTYEELRMATDGFSDANLLGQGGFGFVHKGTLPDGEEVAVKQLKAGSGQGEREFQAEVEIINRVHHKHLVSLVGYCITGTERLLVYEFVPNNTLQFHLHGMYLVTSSLGMENISLVRVRFFNEYMYIWWEFISGKDRPTIDWPTRLKVAVGSAKGLAYLHEDCHPKIIHRDIKAANILLDFKFEAKVADFGLAKFFSDTNTHVTTRVMGTFGYLAPEYASSGKLTEKSDVFSFGVMLLELITGRKPVDTKNIYMDDSLVDWVSDEKLASPPNLPPFFPYVLSKRRARPKLTRALEDGNIDSLVDPKLKGEYNHEEMARMIACAAACVRHSARRRPRMSKVVRALEGDASISDLSEGVRPGHSTLYSSDYGTRQYNDDLKKFRKMALAGQEYGSSEYSETTTEYGAYPIGSSSEGTRERETEMKKRNPSRD
ncbi:hypothetical protein SAY86_022626 [Trapa natans]|uniref:non-specific serine/threonine protein kinase n=1 Tax=Trapa natans TaxID=22666 RepID=A0AAN7LTA1_TRANT|nr:hypothetical protein SAY86_022626 [Trapa natans]